MYIKTCISNHSKYHFLLVKKKKKIEIVQPFIKVKFTYVDIIHHKRFDVPESALTPVIIYHLIFDVNFMGVRLSDHD